MTLETGKLLICEYKDLNRIRGGLEIDFRVLEAQMKAYESFVKFRKAGR